MTACLETLRDDRVDAMRVLHVGLHQSRHRDDGVTVTRTDRFTPVQETARAT